MMNRSALILLVIPAKAGSHAPYAVHASSNAWAPAFAGETNF